MDGWVNGCMNGWVDGPMQHKLCSQKNRRAPQVPKKRLVVVGYIHYTRSPQWAKHVIPEPTTCRQH